MVAKTKQKRLQIAIEDSLITHVLNNQSLRWRDKLPDSKLIYDIITFSFSQKKKPSLSQCK